MISGVTEINFKRKTFHIVVGGDKATTVGEIVNYAIRYFNQTGPRKPVTGFQFLPNSTFDMESSDLSAKMEKIIKSLQPIEQYLNWNRCFDNTNTTKALYGSGITPPKLSDYYDNILDCYLNRGSNQLKKCAA